MKNKAKVVLSALVLSLSLIGCASNNYSDAPPTLGVMYSKYAYLGYDGEQLPIEDVGIVTTDGMIQIKSVDGTPMSAFTLYKTSGFYSGGRYQLHLMPGAHTLVMGFHSDHGTGTISWSTTDLTRQINIAKGQVIHLSLGQSGRKWNALESDGSSALAMITKDFTELSSKK